MALRACVGILFASKEKVKQERGRGQEGSRGEEGEWERRGEEFKKNIIDFSKLYVSGALFLRLYFLA